MATSQHLDDIIEKHNRVASAQVVFLDIVKYSKRRTQNQIAVIDAFTDCLRIALESTAKDFLPYFQANNLNMSTDVITIPTGDGAAVVLTFEGLADIHLKLTLHLLSEINASNDGAECSRYSEEGWCNCHPLFEVRVGVSEGKAVIYEDVNGNYNVAGNPINMAARVMGQVGASQIAFTPDAFDAIIDMVADPRMVDDFARYEDVGLKHDVKLDIYQYVGSGHAGLDVSEISDLVVAGQLRDVMARLGSPFGGLFPTDETPSPTDLLEMMSRFEAAMKLMGGSDTVPLFGARAGQGLIEAEDAIEARES